MILLTVLFYLLASHALADFALQNDTTAVNKNRNAKTELQKYVPWYYWLGSHAVIHGLGVALITQSAILGLSETVAHFFIDFAKCERWYSIHIDQLLHVCCKIVWAIIWLFIIRN